MCACEHIIRYFSIIWYFALNTEYIIHWLLYLCGKTAEIILRFEENNCDLEENVARFLFYSDLIAFLMDRLFSKEKERMYESRVDRKVGRM